MQHASRSRHDAEISDRLLDPTLNPRLLLRPDYQSLPSTLTSALSAQFNADANQQLTGKTESSTNRSNSSSADARHWGTTPVSGIGSQSRCAMPPLSQ